MKIGSFVTEGRTKCSLSGLRQCTTYTPSINSDIITLEHDGIAGLAHFMMV